MSTLPPALHRFVPTLTEVVPPASLVSPVYGGLMSDEVLTKLLIDELSSVIERRLAQTAEKLAQKLVSEHFNNVEQILKNELETIIRKALHQARSSDFNQHKQK